ncbi:MAG: hypothetical protein ABSF44_12105 [Candidatus Bathyarchaeia archaeon]
MYYATAGTGATIPSTLAPIATTGTGAPGFAGTYPFGGTTNNLALSGTDLVLSSGGTMVIYITSPDSVTINDIGLTIGLTVFSAQKSFRICAACRGHFGNTSYFSLFLSTFPGSLFCYVSHPSTHKFTYRVFV